MDHLDLPIDALQPPRPSRWWSSLRDPDAVFRDCNRWVPSAGSPSLGRSALKEDND